MMAYICIGTHPAVVRLSESAAQQQFTPLRRRTRRSEMQRTVRASLLLDALTVLIEQQVQGALRRRGSLRTGRDLRCDG